MSTQKSTTANSAITRLHIMPGLFCNFTCAHCVNASGPDQSLKLTAQEIERIQAEIVSLRPGILAFTGGEPTLHVDQINPLILSHPELESVQVQVTTNGWFSKSRDKIHRTLSQFAKVTEIQLSYDVFHGTKIDLENIRLLSEYCREVGLGFHVSMCISSPADLIRARKLVSDVGVEVAYQKVEASGRAREKNAAFKYPAFEPEVLDKKCPNLGTMNYICGQGFTVCCSNLAFNSKTPGRAHPSVSEHYASEFYRALSEQTFGEMLKARNIPAESLQPKHSSPCGICEYIHEPGSSGA